MRKRLILGGLAAWAACAFLIELNHTVTAWDDRGTPMGAWAWRFQIPETDALARSLDVARPAIPPGTVIAFTALEGRPQAAFEVWRWTAYLMPEYDVIPVDDPAVGDLARYAIAYKTEIHHPRAEPILRLPDGWLYRVKRP
ncbi:MAG TPA: hypothetical protein VGM86_35375 [Thermoanaerobaculia bacterium]|jgi:hypothetical protein